MSSNGRLTDSELTAVYGGRLANATAAAWLAMVAAAARAGVSLVIAGGNTEGGSGAYRDYFVQGDMKVRPWLYGLSAYSTVSIASAGYSTHGFGTAVDIGSFPPARNPRAYGDAGQSRRDWVLAHAAEFGFTRTFGESDPNHFGHNGTTEFMSASFASNGLTHLEIDVPLTDAEMTTIANRAADAVWNFMLAEPPEGVTPGKAHPAGDWVRYMDAREIATRAVMAAPLNLDVLAAAIVAKLPTGTLTAAQIVDEIKARL